MSEWSQLECEAIIQDYMAMFGAELKGEPYSKAEHRRGLLPKLNSRSKGSVEFKHQNISAVLIELGYPYIIGYKPAWNYQKLLHEVVESYLSVNHKQIEVQANELIMVDPVMPKPSDWLHVLAEAPEAKSGVEKHKVREFRPQRYNFTEREKNNRSLGFSGEEFVMGFEKHRLSHAGRDDLVKEIEWTSKIKGDGTGYDIRSFNPEKDEELFIEVKTTNSGKYQPFYISDNEVAFSELNANHYSLYRVFQFRDDPKLFTLDGNLMNQLNLEPMVYRAGF